MIWFCPVPRKDDIWCAEDDVAMGGEAPGPSDGEGRSIPPNDMITALRVHKKLLLLTESRNFVWTTLQLLSVKVHPGSTFRSKHLVFFSQSLLKQFSYVKIYFLILKLRLEFMKDPCKSNTRFVWNKAHQKKSLFVQNSMKNFWTIIINFL
jgi:hypothetical protein